MSDDAPDLNRILLGFLSYVENERVRSYNEGLDAGVAQMRQETDDAKADALRLHRDKMAYFDAALALVHSETIKNVCGWYPEIEAFRKLISPGAERASLTADK